MCIPLCARVGSTGIFGEQHWWSSQALSLVDQLEKLSDNFNHILEQLHPGQKCLGDSENSVLEESQSLLPLNPLLSTPRRPHPWILGAPGGKNRAMWVQGSGRISLIMGKCGWSSEFWTVWSQSDYASVILGSGKRHLTSQCQNLEKSSGNNLNIPPRGFRSYTSRNTKY